MKLIIDIPNRIYVMTKETKQVIDADNEYVASAIANGTPLDDVKVENKGEWIPVFERLPENDGHYLVTWVDGNYQTVDIKGFANHLCEIDEIDFGNKTHSGWYEYDSEYGHYEWDGVVAWMPLPKPFDPQEREG